MVVQENQKNIRQEQQWNVKFQYPLYYSAVVDKSIGLFNDLFIVDNNNNYNFLFRTLLYIEQLIGHHIFTHLNSRLNKHLYQTINSNTLQYLTKKQQLMTTLNLTQIFPQLKQKLQHYFSEQQLLSMPYFKQLSLLLPQTDLTPYAKKYIRQFKLLNVKKGTPIYINSSQSNSGYFLCHGCVKLLIKKNNRQKLQTHNPKHILHSFQQRVKYLNQQFGIAHNKAEYLMNEFYEEKILFKYLEYGQIYGQGYFGINDMAKNTSRPFFAIASQDTILLEIQKSQFQGQLKQLQMKKQETILKSLLQNFVQSSQVSLINSLDQEVKLKLSSIFSHFLIKIFEMDELIYKQGSNSQFIYYILNGEVQLSKSYKLQTPKKFINSQNKPIVEKEIQLKVSRLAEKSYLGQIQHFLHSSQHQFTATSMSSTLIALQIQPYIFMKIMFEFATVQRDLTVSAKQKLSIASESYFKQKNKITKLFLQQFQNIENKKKQKILSNLLNNQEDGHQSNLMTQINSNMFEVFSKQGVFFRDTYQRLSGFEEFQQIQANNKRAAIRKYKVQTAYVKGSKEDKQLASQLFNFRKTINEKQGIEEFEPFNSKEKLLNSPKKNLSIFQLMSGTVTTSQLEKERRQSFTSQRSSSQQLIKSNSKIKKFNQLQKDEAVFKRVLIKNGRFQQDKSTYKEHIIKPIVHPKFDDIVKQCMGRKNHVIRKAIGQNQTQFVKDTYQSVVGDLKNKSMSISKFSRFGQTTTCKGTQQFRKKLQMINRHNRKSDYNSGIRNRVDVESETLEQCIGVNKAPQSSYQKNRSDVIMRQTNKNLKSNQSQNFNNTVKVQTPLYSGFGKRSSSHTDLNSQGRKSVTNGFNRTKNSSDKIILLNHMMKPITYSSVHY